MINLNKNIENANNVNNDKDTDISEVYKDNKTDIFKPYLTIVTIILIVI